MQEHAGGMDGTENGDKNGTGVSVSCQMGSLDFKAVCWAVV